MIKIMRKNAGPLLLVDTGGVLSGEKTSLKLRADMSYKGMKIIGYNAVNLGASDFYYGSNYLKETAAVLSIPFVSTNLLSKTDHDPWFKKYMIKDFGGIRVGILGLMSPFNFEAMPYRDKITGFSVVDPESALKEILPKIRNQVDVVLLLSRLSPEETNVLIQNISGIDMAVIAPASCKDFPFTGADHRPLMLCAEPKGESLGLVEIQKLSDDRFRVLNKKQIALGDAVAPDPEINSLVTRAWVERKTDSKKREAEHRELLKGLKMSPEEFFKRLENNPSQKSRAIPIK